MQVLRLDKTYPVRIFPYSVYPYPASTETSLSESTMFAKVGVVMFSRIRIKVLPAAKNGRIPHNSVLNVFKWFTLVQGNY